MNISSASSQDTLRILAAGAQVDMTAIKQKKLEAADPQRRPGGPADRVDTFEQAKATPFIRTSGGVLLHDPGKDAITKTTLDGPILQADAQGTRIAAQDQPITPRPGPDSTEPEPDTRTFNEADRDALLAAWGARVGDERYNPMYDLTGDGMIGAADLAALLSRFTSEPAVEPEPSADPAPGSDAELTLEKMISELRSMWGARTGSERYDARYDLDGDGVIGSADLAMLLGGARPPTISDPLTHTPAGEDDPTSTEVDGAQAPINLQGLLDAFGRRVGEPGFDARYDLNGDGVISSADLAELLGALTNDASERDGDDPLKTPFTLADFGDFRALLGQRLGMAAYNPLLDLDADGLLSVKDLAASIGRLR